MDLAQLKRMEPIFGSWYVDHEIGSGSFGKVYKIYKDDAGVRFWAALKTISIPTHDSEIQELDSQGFDLQEKIRYFNNIAASITEEIKILNTLRGYSNIVCFEDHQTLMHEDGIGRDILIRMELLNRLDDHMKRIRATHYDVVCMLKDIAHALVLCDKRNIIHRDIKPGNIMVSENGDYKLVDFGISRNMEKVNQASTKAGTPDYMAPEVHLQQPYGKLVDVYSLGIVAYRELNANRIPFLPPYPTNYSVNDRGEALVRRFRGEKIPPIPGVNKQLFAIIEKCTAYKPEHRYPNAMALLNDLQAVMQLPDLKKKYIYDKDGKLLPPSNGSREEEKRPAPRGIGKKIALVLAGTMLAASIGLFFLIFRNQHDENEGLPVPNATIHIASTPQATPPVDTALNYWTKNLSDAGSAEITAYIDGEEIEAALWQGADAMPDLPQELPEKGYYLVLPQDLDEKAVHSLRVVISDANDLETPDSFQSLFRINAESRELEFDVAPAQISFQAVGAWEEQDVYTYDADAGWMTIEGSAEPGLTVQLSGDYRFQKETTQVQKDGQFSFSVNLDRLRRNQETPLTVSYPNLLQGESLSSSIRLYYNAPFQLEFDEKASNAAQVTGKTESGARVYMEVDGFVHEERADEEGIFLFQNFHLHTADDIYLWVQDDHGNQSEREVFHVQVHLDVPAFSSETLNEDTHEIRGSADPGSTVTVSNESGETLGTAAADTQGNFAVSLDTLQAGDTLYIQATDFVGNQSERTRLGQVLRGKRMSLKATVRSGERVLENGDVIGKAPLTIDLEEVPRQAVIARLSVGNDEIQRYGVEDGHADIEEAAFQDWQDGDEIVLTLSYADDELNEEYFSRVYRYDAFIAVPSLDQQELTEDTTSITGTTEAMALVQLWVDGERKDAQPADEAGRFRFERLSLAANQQVVLYAVDSVGNESDGVQFSVQDRADISCLHLDPPLTENYWNSKIETLELTGTAEADRDLEFYLNGNKVSSTAVFNGGWTVQLTSHGLSAGTEYTLCAQYTGLPLENAYVLSTFIYDPACEAIEITSNVTEDSTEITGSTEQNATLHLLDEDQKVISSGMAGDDGRFVLSLESSSLRAGQALRLQAEDKAGNPAEQELLVEQVVRRRITIAGDAFVPKQDGEGVYLLPGNAQQLRIQGTADGNRKLLITIFDGQQKPVGSLEVPADENGAWVSNDLELGSNWDVISIKAAYADGKYPETSAEIIFEKDALCELSSDVDAIKENSVALTIYAEAGAELHLKVNGEEQTQITLSEKAYTFDLQALALKAKDSVLIEATDPVGNQAVLTFVVGEEERMTPTIALDDPDGIWNVDQNAITFHGTGTPLRPMLLSLRGTYLAGEESLTSDHGRNLDFACRGIMTDEKGNWSYSLDLETLKSKTGLETDVEAAFSCAVGYEDREERYGEAAFLYDRLVTLFHLDQTGVDEDASRLTGQVEEKATVWATVAGEKYFASVQDDGHFAIDLPAANLHAGDSLAVMVQDQAGNSIENSIFIEAVHRQAITLEIASQAEGLVKAGCLQVSGTKQADKAIVLQLLSGDNVLEKISFLNLNNSPQWNHNFEQRIEDGKRYTLVAFYEDGKSPESEARIDFAGDGVCQAFSQLPDPLYDTMTELSGFTESGAKVRLSVDGKEKVVTADEVGRFHFDNVPFAYGAYVELQATDRVGNTEEWSSTVKTNKKWITDGQDSYNPIVGPKSTEYTSNLFVSFRVFSWDECEFYFTLTSDQDACQYVIPLENKDISTGDDVLEKAKKAKGLEENQYNIKYYYEWGAFIPLNDLKTSRGQKLPFGNYDFQLFAKSSVTQEETAIGAPIALTLCDPGTIERKTDYVHAYEKFALGLDAPVMDTFPANELLFTGWIYAPQGTLDNLGVEIKISTEKVLYDDVSFKDNFVIQYGYRNVAQEHPEYAQYGKPDLEKGGIVVQVKLNGPLALAPGNYAITLMLYDKTDPNKEYSFGTYEIKISNDRKLDVDFDANTKMNQVISEWRQRK